MATHIITELRERIEHTHAKLAEANKELIEIHKIVSMAEEKLNDKEE